MYDTGWAENASTCSCVVEWFMNNSLVTPASALASSGSASATRVTASTEAWPSTTVPGRLVSHFSQYDIHVELEKEQNPHFQSP